MLIAARFFGSWFCFDTNKRFFALAFAFCHRSHAREQCANERAMVFLIRRCKEFSVVCVDISLPREIPLTVCVLFASFPQLKSAVYFIRQLFACFLFTLSIQSISKRHALARARHTNAYQDAHFNIVDHELTEIISSVAIRNSMVYC